MDLLQEKIRKLKCPIVLDLGVDATCIPAHLQGDLAALCREMLETFQGVLPAVRFSFDQFALMEDGTQKLSSLLKLAGSLGYFVLLDGPGMLSPWAAQRAADGFFGENSLYPCDGLVLSPYIGSDAIKPFLLYCKAGKSVFYAVRSANKSAAEVQDLMTGGRLTHQAVADIVNRHGEAVLCKCGYYAIGALTAATNGGAVKNLRIKYNRMFLLVDGYDYPGGNGKNACYGFDKFGHGCAVSVGPAIVGAWREEGDGTDYLERAQQALKRIQNNLKTYVTVL